MDELYKDNGDSEDLTVHMSDDEGEAPVVATRQTSYGRQIKSRQDELYHWY